MYGYESQLLKNKWISFAKFLCFSIMMAQIAHAQEANDLERLEGASKKTVQASVRQILNHGPSAWVGYPKSPGWSIGDWQNG